MSTVKVWAADPHQYGPGKIHAIDSDDDDRTYCGVWLRACPGNPVTDKQPNCRRCLNAIENRVINKSRDELYERQRRENEAQRDREDREWHQRYDTYIRSPAWQRVRTLVLERARGICEGCMASKAVHAHHMTYAHLGQEFLWELRAVCRDCHERFHEKSMP